MEARVMKPFVVPIAKRVGAQAALAQPLDQVRPMPCDRHARYTLPGRTIRGRR
jgi:hypothetical protein